MTATNVFDNVDGTDYPGGATYGWSVQGSATYPGHANFSVPTLDKTNTPANVSGWTVQSVGEGGDKQ